MKKYGLLLMMFVAAVLVAISGNWTQSTTNSAYKTEISSQQNVSVAKWDINEIEKAGEGVMMSAGMAKLEGGSKGNWFFQLTNKSQTNAEIYEDITIDVKLVSDIFSTNSYNTLDSYSWDYLKSKNNPITFKLYFYDEASLNDLLEYQKDGVKISYDEYVNLENKDGYTENIKITNKPIIDTSDETADGVNDLKLQTELDGDKVVHYLTQTFIISKDMIAKFGLGSTAKCKTFRLEWEIEGESSSGDSQKVTYKVYNKPTSSTDNSYVEYELFDYLKYLSSIKGEPSFEFVSETGGTIEVKASKLTAEQKAQLEEYQLKNISEWEKFRTDYERYLDSLGYLEAGLTCSFNFNIVVSQVD